MTGALSGLAGLSALAPWFADVPRPVAALLGVVAVAYGAGCAVREMRRHPVSLVVRGDGVHVDGWKACDFEVLWRGPLVVMRWRTGSGACERRAWLPDTLPLAERRELRLAVLRTAPARVQGSVAP